MDILYSLIKSSSDNYSKTSVECLVIDLCLYIASNISQQFKLKRKLITNESVTQYPTSQFTQIRPCLYGEKLSRVEGSPAYQSYPGRANFSYISLQNLANRLYEKQKVGSARRVTRLVGSSFCDGRVTLLARPTFLHINTSARSAGTTPRKLKSVFYLKNEHCGLNCYQRS